MLARLCQLKSLLLILLFLVNGCSFFRKEVDSPVELLSSISGEWFKKNAEHSLWDQDAKPKVHNFFDVAPELGTEETYTNAIILTPEGSKHGYQLDMLSGQRYYSHTYCSQKDIWNQYNSSLENPTFSMGIIPRLMDQLGEPQKVMIFGGKSNFTKLTDSHEHRIRLIGAFIEQSCPRGNCLGKNNWLSRMVFIAIDPNDKKFENIKDIATLKTQTEWAMHKAVYENLDGRNGGTGASYPAVRMGNAIELSEAMEYYKKRSIFLSQKEAAKIQLSCQNLYNKAWTEVGMELAQDKPAKTKEELNAKLKLIEELKKKRIPVNFSARMAAFTSKYFNEYVTCQKFVYAGNINQNVEKFWFLSYLGIYLRLHKDGYAFDCMRKTWKKNVLDSTGVPLFDIKSGLLNCSDKDLDRAMDYLPNFLVGLKNSENTFYKFVDYDSSTMGTHQKMYSWVKLKNQKFDCSRDPNLEIKKEIRVFPEEVSWKPRHVTDLADEMKIIY